MSEDYVLYHWDDLAGRGEFIRLMFEETGQPYKEVGNDEDIEKMYSAQQKEGFPNFAPPILKKGRHRRMKLQN